MCVCVCVRVCVCVCIIWIKLTTFHAIQDRMKFCQNIYCDVLISMLNYFSYKYWDISYGDEGTHEALSDCILGCFQIDVEVFLISILGYFSA